MILETIILAAGVGTRMRSSIPKALHKIGGKAMLQHVIEVADSLVPAKIHVVIGAQGERVKSEMELALDGQTASGMDKTSSKQCAILDKITWALQPQPLGSGHAALQAMPGVGRDAMLLFLYADTPLIGTQTLKKLLAAVGDKPVGGTRKRGKPAQNRNRIAVLTAMMENPTGLGRIVRNEQDEIVRIVEEKDATDRQKQLRECNTGFLSGPADVIQHALARLDNNNAQKEFYLTDLIAHATADGGKIVSYRVDDVEQTFGVNSPVDLARTERIFQVRQAHRLLEQGVQVRDPARFDVRGHCEFGGNCEVDINVILEGEVVVGERCRIGANTIIRNSRIGNDSVIEANCVIDDAVIGAKCMIGPFARLRPDTQLDDEIRIGNFVEVKHSHIGTASKISHLSYIGDSKIGQGVNIGAGVITCNYDGVHKQRTVIGDGVFVGANSQLLAPLTIGTGATIGAGSTVTADVADNTLAIARARQTSVDGWVRPDKK